VESIMIQMAKESGVSNNELARTNGIVTTTWKTYGLMQLETFWLRSWKFFEAWPESYTFLLTVTCHLIEFLIQVNKENPKRHGGEFHDWLNHYCPGLCLLLVICACGGNKKDAEFEGTLSVYDAPDEMLQFTNPCLLCSENKLQHCLYLSLGSMEFVALLRCASIVHVAMVLPMRWLAGNTHKLDQCQWGKRFILRLYDHLQCCFRNSRDWTLSWLWLCNDNFCTTLWRCTRIGRPLGLFQGRQNR
jgi:hypothetical protein